MKKSWLLVTFFAVGLSLALLPGPARAASPFLDFGQGAAPQSGDMFMVGSDVFGSGIALDSLIVGNAPLKNGQHDMSGAGPDGSGANGSAVLVFNTSTRAITITGGVPDFGIGPVSLLTGAIRSFTVTPLPGGGFAFSGTGSDTKDPTLLAAVGIPVDMNFTFFGFSFTGSPIPSAPGHFQATSTDFKNTAVPEPGTLLLLGLGLFGLSATTRRARQK